jgi:hypothetical protein
MRIYYDPELELDWNTFFVSQIGRGNTPYFEGYEIQYGNGKQIGGFSLGPFRAPLRLLLPIFKRAGKAIRNELLATGGRVAADYLTGQPLKTTIKRQARRGLHNLALKAAAQLAEDANEQSGSGKRRRRRNVKPSRSKAVGTFRRLPGGLVIKTTGKPPAAVKNIVPFGVRKARPIQRVVTPVFP